MLILTAAALSWVVLALAGWWIVSSATGHELAAPPRTPAAMRAYAPDLAAREAARPHPSWAHLRRMVASRWMAEHPAARRHAAEHRRIHELHLLVRPYRAALECIAGHESHSTWTISTGNGYYGGLQMDRDFARTYGAGLYSTKGTPDRWTKLEQMAAAARAINVRGFTPWPNTARMCGLLTRATRSPLVVENAKRVAKVQTIADRTADLLARILRRPVDHRTVVTFPASGLPGAWAGAYAGGTTIYLRPWVVRDLETRSPDLTAARILRHELLHTVADLDPTCPLTAREGVVDAVAGDTQPQWAALFGFPVYMDGRPGYPGPTRIVRRWSVSSTGQPVQSVAARQARRELLELTCHARAVTLGLER